jgi:hypothetical protein
MGDVADACTNAEEHTFQEVSALLTEHLNNTQAKMKAMDWTTDEGISHVNTLLNEMWRSMEVTLTNIDCITFLPSPLDN